MKYNLVEIKMEGGKWRVEYAFLPDDKIVGSEQISPLGYYYFEELRPKELAFRKLQKLMILERKEEITRLQENLRKLRNLTPTGENYENLSENCNGV